MPQEISTNDETVFLEAIRARNIQFDGTFYYGVRSTGIYCRPSCRSRQPRPEQVVFFALPEAAARSGFRSCLRCRPDETRARDPRAALVQRICHTIEQGQEGALGLAALAEMANLSRFQIQRLFKRMMGITPRQYADACRNMSFKTRVREGFTIAGAMYESGYGSSSRLYEKAAGKLGMTPKAYQRKGEGVRITYTVVTCALGHLLIAATDRGVCSVALGDSGEALVKALKFEYQRAEIRRDESNLSEWAELLLEHLAGERPHLDLPLDVQATAFQERVWEELRRIPYGSTASYGEIARRIGQPTASRAVARACATNPVALITPCHRVIRGSGRLGGYRWGLERKQNLLEREGSSIKDNSAERGERAESLLQL